MINKYTLTLLTTFIFLLTVPHIHAWIEPTTIPPGNNIYAPLNSSAFGQSKVGGLILNLGNAAHGLIVRYGLVGIGTDNPQAALDVVGKVRSTGLEVNSTTEGALLPRMTTVQRDAITNKVEGLLIYNIDTKQLEIYADGAWKASSGGGDSLPKGTIAFFNLSACPSGWTEKTELKGRYPVGLPNSGTLGQSVGTALTNGENRSVGQHGHGVTDPGHSHLYSALVGGFGSGFPRGEWYEIEPTPTTSSKTNISIQNSGSVAGTNAPYVQFLACEKQTAGSSGSGGSSTSNFWQNNGTSIYYNDGNVGVGTSTPAQKMEVSGNVKATGVCIGNDCKNAWPTTTSTDTLQTVTDRGATTTKNISPAGLCLGSDCRSSWPVHTYWVYNTVVESYRSGSSYDLVMVQPEGKINYVNTHCYCHIGPGYYGGVETVSYFYVIRAQANPASAPYSCAKVCCKNSSWYAVE